MIHVAFRNLAAKRMFKPIVKSEGLKAHRSSRGSSNLIDLPNRCGLASRSPMLGRVRDGAKS